MVRPRHICFTVMQWIVIIFINLTHILLAFRCSSGKRELANVTAIPFTGKQPDAATSLPNYIEVKISSKCVNYTAFIKRNRRFNTAIPVYTAREGVQALNHVTENKRSGLYRDADGTCSFYIDLSNAQIIDVHGYFYDNGYFYTVSQLYDREGGYTIMKHTFPNANKKPACDNQSVLEHLPDTGMWKSAPKHKRQALLYEVELCLVLDHTVFESFSETNSNVSEEVYHIITRYYNLIVNGVDSRFRNIRGSGYVINILMAGLYLAQDSKSSPWIHLTDESSGPVVSEKSLKALADWSIKQKDLWSKCDHVMAVTAKNLAHDGSTNTLGLSYLQSMCTNRSYSIIEDHGNMAYVSHIAAHELAHSLGAKHDGVPAKVRFNDRTAVCLAEDGYIMTSKASSIPDLSLEEHLRSWMFSPCSYLYFEFYIHHLDTHRRNCLVERNVAVSQAFTDTDEASDLLTDIDHYCETIVGEGAVLSRQALPGNISDICRSVPCTGPRQSGLVPTLAMEGLVCGFRQSCQAGRCQPSEKTRHPPGVNSACPFGDQPGPIGRTGRTCSEVLHSPGQVYRCYSLEAECCYTCYTYRRFTSLPDCRYGDKEENCTDRKCGTDVSLCCETCAVYGRKLAECQQFQSPINGHVSTNTGAYYEGSVALFSCYHGYSLHGNATSICTSAGVWSSSVPVCVLGCAQLVLASYVTVDLSGKDYSVGTEVTFSCLHGFVFQGQPRVYCQNDSTWSGQTPYCTLEFSSLSTIEIPENSQSSSFWHTLETGEAKAHFSLIGYSHRGFNITEDGHVTAQENTSFNYENIKTYRLTVTATSRLDPRLKAKQTLTVQVTDTNDAPVFTEPEYTIQMSPPIARGWPLLTVSASDEDLGNQTLTYRCTACGLYTINETTGQISPLREIKDDYHSVNIFNVFAVDDGQPRQTATALVRICVGGETNQCGARSGCGCQLCRPSALLNLVFVILGWCL